MNCRHFHLNIKNATPEKCESSKIIKTGPQNTAMRTTHRKATEKQPHSVLAGKDHLGNFE